MSPHESFLQRELSKSLGLAWIMHEMDRGYTGTARQIAVELGVSQRTVERWMLDLSSIYPLTDDGAYRPRYSRAERIRRIG